MTEIDFVLVCFQNSRADVDSLVNSLLAGADAAGVSAGVQLVLNDDGAESEWIGDWSLIAGQGNVGFAEGIRLAIDRSLAKYIIVVNPDCLVDEIQLKHFIDSLDERSIIVPRLVHEDGTTDYYAYENWTFYLGRKVSEWRCKRLFATLAREAVELPSYAKAPGAFLGLSRELALRLDGPFDSAFLLYAEDRDLTNRARAAGVPVLLSPVEIVHIGGVSGRGHSELVTYCQTDGSLRVASRRYGRFGSILFSADVVIFDLLRHSRLRQSTRAALKRWKENRFRDPGRISAEELASLGRNS